MVVQTSETDFNMYLRPDTNTRGYCNWFYFKMSRANRQAQTVRINILNMYKRKTLYRHNAKPLVCFDLENVDTKWHSNQITDVEYVQVGSSKFTTAQTKNSYLSPSNARDYRDLADTQKTK